MHYKTVIHGEGTKKYVLVKRKKSNPDGKPLIHPSFLSLKRIRQGQFNRKPAIWTAPLLEAQILCIPSRKKWTCKIALTSFPFYLSPPSELLVRLLFLGGFDPAFLQPLPESCAKQSGYPTAALAKLEWWQTEKKLFSISSLSLSHSVSSYVLYVFRAVNSRPDLKLTTRHLLKT